MARHSLGPVSTEKSIPFWIAARNSIFSAISCKETSSGNWQIASKTICADHIKLVLTSGWFFLKHAANHERTRI